MNYLKLAKLCVLSGLLALGGCRPRDGRSEIRERVLMHTSFEELADWGPAPQHPSLTTVRARSGQTGVCIDEARPYSVTYRNKLGNLCDHRPRRFTFSAWVWVPSEAEDAMFVVAITNPSDPQNPVFSKNVFLNESGPYQAWKQVSRDLALPPNISSNSELVIYLWRYRSAAPVYTDDWQLTELY